MHIYSLYLKKSLSFRYLEFEAKHGHYLARRNKAAEKNEEMKARRSPSPVGESPMGLEIAFCSSVLSPEGKVKLAMKWSSRRIVDQFRKAVPYRLTTQNAKRLKAKAGRR
uniref:Uncharacterized protein n=1 Tax=Solanum tuberosum TaxID=4113 RepID=M1DDV5_SOLTU